MKQDEYMKKIKQLGIKLESLNIVIGRKTNIPNSIGCYKENDIWYFYDVNERQSLVVTKSGGEDEIFSYLYLLTKALLKQYSS
jgi:hypothetical protein